MEITAPSPLFTQHAAMRLAQRGFRTGDVETIIAIGTPVEGGYLVREKDVVTSDQAPRRLAGARVVIKSGRVITAYHANKSKSRRLLRGRTR